MMLATQGVQSPGSASPLCDSAFYTKNQWVELAVAGLYEALLSKASAILKSRVAASG
jgi:hypothetical protein